MAKKQNTFEDVFIKNQYDLKTAVKKSQTWFQQQARELAKQRIQPQKLINSAAEQNVSRILPGELYLFHYDAKHSDILPYWDMYPMVFPFRKLKDGFIGLNMHYLPYQWRIKILDRLMEFRTTKGITPNTRLRYSWGLISSAARYKFAVPCVHRYLYDHVQSPFKRIEPPDWTTALMLPVERFVGASNRRVWTESTSR